MPTATLSRTLAGAASAAALLAAAGCATGPDVRADYDRNADFAAYRSFAFVSPLGTDRAGYQSLLSQHLRAATQRELESRGLRFDAAAPQLLVNFNVRLDDRMQVSSVPVPVTGGVAVGAGRGYYGYRSGLYGAWPLYADRTVVSEYTEGTLNIDLVDASRRQLVWEGVVSDTVTGRHRDNPQPAIEAAVKAAFEKFPRPVTAAAAAK
ncbi:MAG: DUF4136 domain-containing protein [Rubrivivax sp.]|jgi:hypothetical protein|nr:DUF4136 domain-containing protein [Rubrivivax sp.]